MRRKMIALLLVAVVQTMSAVGAAEEGAESPEPAGMWRGQLDPAEGLRARPLQLVLHIRHGKDGYVATLDGLGGGLRNVTVEGLILVEDVLSFQVPQVGARFAGNFYGDSLRGTWTQGDSPLTLIFYRD